MKECKKCHVERKLDEFYKHKGMKDGHLSFCKECVKRRIVVYRKNNPDILREIDRKKYLKRHKEQAAWQVLYNKTNPRARIRRYASGRIANLIRYGKITRESCKICGDKKSHAHHDDYTKPLEIQWFCIKHHKEWHKNNNPIY